jgi:glycosyltransferase involved in cell wall biosynthesis
MDAASEFISAMTHRETLLISGVFPPDIGGPATHMHQLANRLQQQGKTPKVVTFGSQTAFFPYPVIRFSRKIPPQIRLLLAFYWIAKSGKHFDIVYSSGGPWDANGLAFLAKWLLKKSWYARLSGDTVWERARLYGWSQEDIEEFQKSHHAWWISCLQAFQSRIYQSADGVVVSSLFLKSLAESWGVPREKIIVVPNQASTYSSPLDKEGSRNRLGFTGFVMLTVGRLVPWKGVDVIVELLTELDESVSLVIVGSGPSLNMIVCRQTFLDTESRFEFAL